MEDTKYQNPPLDLDKRSLIAQDSERFNEIIDHLITEFSKKTIPYYCKKIHSIETRTSASHKNTLNASILQKERL